MFNSNKYDALENRFNTITKALGEHIDKLLEKQRLIEQYLGIRYEAEQTNKTTAKYVKIKKLTKKELKQQEEAYIQANKAREEYLRQQQSNMQQLYQQYQPGNTLWEIKK